MNDQAMPIDESADLSAPLDALQAELPPVEGGSAVEGAAATPDVPTGELLAGLLVPLTQVLAPAWGVTEAECKTLGDAWGCVVDKYFPSGLGAYGVEISAVLVTVAVFGPRWGRPRKQDDKNTSPLMSSGVVTAAELSDDGTVNHAAPSEPATPRL